MGRLFPRQALLVEVYRHRRLPDRMVPLIVRVIGGRRENLKWQLRNAFVGG